jgi:hypothetical protein
MSENLPLPLQPLPMLVQKLNAIFLQQFEGQMGAIEFCLGELS